MLTTEQQIFERIKKANHILITFGQNWEGDSVASALALCLFLRKIGKKADVVATDSNNKKLYSFLPSFDDINTGNLNLKNMIITLKLNNGKVGQVKYLTENEELKFIITPKEGDFKEEDVAIFPSGSKYDLIFVVDTPDLEMLGPIYDKNTDLFFAAPVINIDHHSSNEEFGQINSVELTAVSTTEILFNLFVNYSREAITEDVATCLLAGLISKTRSFKTPNITPAALSAASQLVSLGARREEIVNNFYRSRSMCILKLWGRILARLSGKIDNQLVWSMISRDDFAKTETNDDDLREVIDELIINIPSAKFIVLFFEPSSYDKPGSRALVYSVKNIDIFNVAKEYDPKGNRHLAYIDFAKPLNEAEKEFIGSLEEKLSKLPL